MPNPLFPDFEEINLTVEPSVTIRGLKSPTNTITDRPPLLLLHGFPQNLNIWHKIAAPLSSAYTVILLDLRGYGQSSKPESSPTDPHPHAAYSKTTMARDIVRAMEQLNYAKFYICAHDRGARVSHRLCVDYPDSVIKSIFLDISPTYTMYSKTDFTFARLYAHWFFLIKAAPFPEKLILGNPRAFLEGQMFGRHQQSSSSDPHDVTTLFHPTALESYVQNLSSPAGVHAMCEDYRAAATIDMDEAKRDIDQGRKIKCPLRVLWGKQGVVEKCFDCVKDWTDVTDEGVEVSGRALDCGHYIPEEQGEELRAEIERFFLKAEKLIGCRELGSEEKGDGMYCKEVGG
ncbi:putative alpha beta hydrolase fold protein [Phaeomoniella chlamydospora]|uniref:Putative alpha beta hydrolase fold protein n=1 Tax=Phaeomoniella chlamydospora TaxID=158046 RepID=A0A0G2E977_PHACM|nr:putative alpha beta hydrolase fold protein [Phaeomoniella chlamydospora]